MTMTMTITMKIAISAILSVRVVGKKVTILKFSVESIDHDHDHDLSKRWAIHSKAIGSHSRHAGDMLSLSTHWTVHNEVTRSRS